MLTKIRFIQMFLFLLIYVITMDKKLGESRSSFSRITLFYQFFDKETRIRVRKSLVCFAIFLWPYRQAVKVKQTF